ncbi:MAG: hypothetical protein H6838_11060 [Planctomycetes bacterium]|nr:hypothetical protein [Planctomycetota bacterium]MCB9886026.1 hypothetical protein [Planctomycetota bacterium]
MDYLVHSEGVAPHGHETFRSPWMMGPRLDYKPMMPVTDPQNRIAFGCVTLAVAWAVIYGVEDVGNGRHWFAGMAAFAVGMIVSGVRQIRHDRRVRRLMDRARGEWSELLVGAAVAKGDGEGIPRFLVRRGYREYFVRRWIADRLTGELEHVAGEPPA